MEWLKTFNSDYAEAVQALTPFVLGFVSFLYYSVFKESVLKSIKDNEKQLNDAELMIQPVFWTFGKKYKILAVHKYQKSDDISGYKHVGQNSRPDQWKKLIDINPSFCGLRYHVIPKNKDDILTVVISRNGSEKWRTIDFNK